MNEIEQKWEKFDEITNAEYEVKYCPAFNTYERTCTMSGLVCKHCNWCRIKSIVNHCKLVYLGVLSYDKEYLTRSIIRDLGVNLDDRNN